MKINKESYNPIYFVGAGPGDVDLITVKGKKLLERADFILYAGSLVNKELLNNCKAQILDSSKLHLEQIVDEMRRAQEGGLCTVRLHTGDPSIYGAIREQMRLLDKLNISYEVIPGVSSAFGAAASLKKELTLPDISQTVILTRVEGRTPVPAKEKLSLLASHNATMMIFLSVSLIDKVVGELIDGGYPPSTPAVVVEKATWPEERVVKGTIESISSIVKDANITKTAMICVGAVFSDDEILTTSKLYDKNFSHGTRTHV